MPSQLEPRARISYVILQQLLSGPFTSWCTHVPAAVGAGCWWFTPMPFCHCCLWLIATLKCLRGYSCPSPQEQATDNPWVMWEMRAHPLGSDGRTYVKNAHSKAAHANKLRLTLKPQLGQPFSLPCSASLTCLHDSPASTSLLSDYSFI